MRFLNANPQLGLLLIPLLLGIAVVMLVYDIDKCRSKPNLNAGLAGALCAAIVGALFFWLF